MDSKQEGRWLPRADAAHALVVHERTMRRQVASGRYPSRMNGHSIEVWLPDVALGDTDSAPGRAQGTMDTAQGDLDTVHGQPGDGAGDVRRIPTDGGAVAALERLVRESLERASIAEQAAAMWQERARNLEAQVEQLLALPAHEEPEPRRRWWRWWRP